MPIVNMKYSIVTDYDAYRIRSGDYSVLSSEGIGTLDDGSVVIVSGIDTLEDSIDTPDEYIVPIDTIVPIDIHIPSLLLQLLIYGDVASGFSSVVRYTDAGPLTDALVVGANGYGIGASIALRTHNSTVTMCDVDIRKIRNINRYINYARLYNNDIYRKSLDIMPEGYSIVVIADPTQSSEVAKCVGYDGTILVNDDTFTITDIHNRCSVIVNRDYTMDDYMELYLYAMRGYVDPYSILNPNVYTPSDVDNIVEEVVNGYGGRIIIRHSDGLVEFRNAIENVINSIGG